MVSSDEKTRLAKGPFNFKDFWLIADLCTFNNDKFEKNDNDIYPAVKDPFKICFFKNSIGFQHRKITIVSNMLSKILCASVRPEIIHIASSAMDLTNIETHAFFLKRMEKQGSAFVCII